MGKGPITKVVGVISDDIVDKYKLYDFRGTEIVQSMDLYIHIQKHLNEFKSVDSFNETINSIPQILLKPRFVSYDSDKKSLLYYKEVQENVCVVVKLKLKKEGPYIATIYPVNEEKILRSIEQSYINKD